MRFTLLSLLLVTVALAAPIPGNQNEMQAAGESNLLARDPRGFIAPKLGGPKGGPKGGTPAKPPPGKAPGQNNGGGNGSPPVRMGQPATANKAGGDKTADPPVRLGQDPADKPPKKDGEMTTEEKLMGADAAVGAVSMGVITVGSTNQANAAQ